MAKYQLMSHQQEGVEFLDSVDGIGALLYDPGVGKTGTTLTWVDRLADREGEVRVLVVAPLTAADTWVLQAPLFMDSPVKARMLSGRTASILDKMRAARSWTGVPNEKIGIDHPGTQAKQVSGNKVTILSMSAGAISSWCQTRPQTVKMLTSIRRYAPHVVIVDESHIIKSATANISKAMYAIGQLAPHRIILTGTVNPHSPLDCYGQWRFLAPWTFSDSYGEDFLDEPLKMNKEQKASIRPWSWTRFRDRYAQLGGFQGKQVIGLDPFTTQELHDRVAERSHVVNKEDALDLPPVTDIDIHVALSPKETRAYEEMRDELAAEMEDGSLLEAPNALAKIMKLRQITAGFARDTSAQQTHIIGNAKRKAVKEVVETQLVGENRVVVFAYFRSECQMLADSLKSKGVTVEVITGQTSNDERLAIRQRFADVDNHPERTILVAQARTMSVSVNELVTAQHAVFASLSERRNDWVQARGRLDRNGQEGSHVTFWNVYVPDSIDEVMLQSHQRRGDLERALLDHIKNTAGSR